MTVTHKQSKTPTYRTWCAMKRRCNVKQDTMYAYYGGRGITYDNRWEQYENFLMDMGERPTKLHTLDRIDNDQPYTASNCRWATRQEQTWNREATVMIEIDGYCKPATVWAREYGVEPSTVIRRYKNGVRGADLFTKGRKYYGKADNSGSNHTQ